MSGWFRIRSWHLLERVNPEHAGFGIAYCGRRGSLAELQAEMPTDGRSCEACFRVREARKA